MVDMGDVVDVFTFGGDTRRKRREQQEKSAAQAAADERSRIQSAYDTYRPQWQQQQTAYEGSMRTADTRMRDSIDQYRSGRTLADQMSDDTRESLYNRRKSEVDTSILNTQGITKEYTDRLNDLSRQSEAQAADATHTYKGTIQPELRSALERSRQYEDQVNSQAMTLAESMDPNNRVAAGQRQLYNSLAEQMAAQYDQASQAERADLEGLLQRGVAGYGGEIDRTRKQGQADYGVLAALGAQAANQQMGGGVPLTGAQQAAILSTQNQQAAEAYAQAQKRMQSLEDQRRAYELAAYERMGDKAGDLMRTSLQNQGLLREAGIAAGTRESGAAYERGVTARDTAAERTAARLADIMRGETDYQSLQERLRGERSGFGRDIYGARSDAEALRAGGLQELFGLRSGIEEGKIQRRYGNLQENMALENVLAGIDANAAERALLSGRTLSAMDLEQSREMAGLERSGILENIMLQQANQQAGWNELMGMLGLGVDIYSGTQSRGKQAATAGAGA